MADLKLVSVPSQALTQNFANIFQFYGFRYLMNVWYDALQFRLSERGTSVHVASGVSLIER